MKAEKKPVFTMTQVKSSQVKSIGHSGDTLAVTFNNGGTYHYHGVSAAQFAELQKAESVGAHLGKHIKSKHKFTKQDNK